MDPEIKDSTDYSLHFAGDTDCLKLVLEVSSALLKGCNPEKANMLTGVIKAMICVSMAEDRKHEELQQGDRVGK